MRRLPGLVLVVASALAWPAGADAAPRVTTIAGNSPATFPGRLAGDGGPALRASLGSPLGVAALPDGSFVIADDRNQRVRRVSPAGIISTVAGSNSHTEADGGPAVSTHLRAVLDVAAWPAGGFVLADSAFGEVRWVRPDGVIQSVAGGYYNPMTGPGFHGDGGPAIYAVVGPSAVGIDPHGGFLIAELADGRIRRVLPDGTIITVAGTGTPDNRGGFSGDGGPATAARLNAPQGVAAMPDGGFLIADTDNNRIRRVYPDGIIRTVAGTGRCDFSGDGGAANAASICKPQKIAVLPSGAYVFADKQNYRVRRVSPSGNIVTVAGDGTNPPAGSRPRPYRRAPADTTQLSPVGLGLRDAHSFYEADDYLNRVRLVTGADDRVAVPRAPLARVRFTARPAGGVVLAGRHRLRHPGSLRMGTVIDARHGAVSLLFAASRLGQSSASVHLRGGRFAVTQSHGSRALTTLSVRLQGCRAQTAHIESAGLAQVRTASRLATVTSLRRYPSGWSVRTSCRSTSITASGLGVLHDLVDHLTIDMRPRHPYVIRARRR